MTMRQKAMQMIEEQPESNLELIINFLTAIRPNSVDKELDEVKMARRQAECLRCWEGKITLPPDFDAQFEAMDEEIIRDFEESINHFDYI